MDTYDNAMNTVRLAFTQWLYPIIIIGVFLIVVGATGYIVSQGRGSGRIRRATGALLPLVILVFALMWVGQTNEPVQQFLSSTNPFFHCLVGAIIGICLLELGIWLQKSDFEIGPALYTLFLSFVSMFILYSAMQRILGQLNYFLVSLIVMSGLYIIFRGLPTPEGFVSRQKENKIVLALKEGSAAQLKLADNQSKLRIEILTMQSRMERIEQIIGNSRAVNSSVEGPAVIYSDVGAALPSSQNNLRERYSSNQIRARYDAVGDLLVNDDNVMSEWLILDNHLLIPTRDVLGTITEFKAHYEKYYSCKEPRAGEIQIMIPATVAPVAGGWQVTRKGELNVK